MKNKKKRKNRREKQKELKKNYGGKSEKTNYWDSSVRKSFLESSLLPKVAGEYFFVPIFCFLLFLISRPCVKRACALVGCKFQLLVIKYKNI